MIPRNLLGCRVGGILPRTLALVFLLAPGACGGDDDGGTGPDPSPGPGPVQGSIQVTAATIGEDADPDGYAITLDGGAGVALGINDTVTFADVEPDDHQLELADVSANCVVQGDNPRSVTVVANAIAETAFEVDCFAPLRNQIVFQTNRDDGNVNLYAMAADGSGSPTRLTSDPASETDPAVSPDGLRIAFTSDRDGNSNIYVMRADGSEWTQLTDDPGFDGQPTWSPDGSKIAFTSSRNTVLSVDRNIFVVDANGESPPEPEQLTNNSFRDTDPAWSPDGSKLAFLRHTNSGIFVEIWVMNADGSNLTPLTDTPDVREGGPAWSPDGQSIAFHANHEGPNDFDIYVMGPNGENPTPRIGEAESDNADAFNPTWSPDGTRIAFEIHPPSAEPEISVGEIGGGLEDLFGVPPSPHPASDRSPAWSP